MRFRRKIFAKLLLIVIVIALLGWIVMRLWNWIIPTLIVDAHVIDYPHAIGLLVLCRILFGGFRGGGGCHKRMQWQRMTPQEREQLRNGPPPASRSNGEIGT
jgi:hypothetical protein